MEDNDYDQMDRATLTLCLLLLWVMAPSHATIHSDDSERRVLLLYSYHPTFPTSPKILDGFLSEFGLPPPVVEVEYMDSKRIYTEMSVALFKQNLAFKLQHRPPYDVVVTADDNALQFMLKEGKQLFPGVPIVFLGLNNLELAQQLAHNPNVTGVVEAVSIKETIELADTLFPDMQTLHIIADGTTSGTSDLLSTLALQPEFPSLPFSVINLAEQGWDSFSQALSRLPPSDAILLLSAYRDQNQQALSFEKSLALILAYSKAPVFHPFEHGMGNGVLGGVMISHKEQARQAAVKVKQLFAGQPIRTIPILDKSPNILVVDKRQMDRFGAPMARLPAQAEIRFNPQSVVALYWREISVTAIVMGLMILIIIMLAYQNRIRASFSKTLAESEQRLRTILNHINAYIYMKDVKGHYLFVNTLMSSLVNKPAEDMLATSDEQLFNDPQAQQRERSDHDVMASQQLHKQEERRWNPSLSAFQKFDTTQIPLINEQGETYGLCRVSLDITEQKNYEQQLKQIAHYDQLTGLPNRVLFSDRLAQAMKKADRQKTELSILYLDLDGFKAINDNYGHLFGDQLLTVITGRITQSIRENDTAARLGGDEFIVLLINSGEPEDDLEITQRILTAVAAPLFMDEIHVTISASIGITRYPQSEKIEADHLLRQADQAMYIAKNSGRNQFHFFDPAIETAAIKHKALISEVKTALKNNEFRLYYQPKVALENGQVIGFEALIRWQHPEKGLIAPDRFLPDIEKHNLMIEIDDWVISDALRQLQEWQHQGLSIPVSINLSHLFFKQKHLVQILMQKLDQYPDVSASLVELEILETQALDNLTEVATVISQCQTLGIRFALDDFGTGFSSLTYLKQLPVNLLKVDRSFVRDMLVDQEDKSILEGILALCQAFNIKAIAEGVETLEHGVALKKMGYQYAQGYGISRPIPAHAILQWVQQWAEPEEWKRVVEQPQRVTEDVDGF